MRVAIRDAARAQRKNATPSESQLWECLRGTRLDGRKFRRQQPVGPFIVDFYCPEERLVVEVDGAVHEGQEIKDAQRQEALESLGLRFVRVTNDEVRFELQAVLTRIRQHFSSSSPLHHPSPLVGEGPGEGGSRRPDSISPLTPGPLP